MHILGGSNFNFLKFNNGSGGGGNFILVWKHDFIQNKNSNKVRLGGVFAVKVLMFINV